MRNCLTQIGLRLRNVMGGECQRFDPNWELLLRDVYLGMARADAGVGLGNLDPRVMKIIQSHQ